MRRLGSPALLPLALLLVASAASAQERSSGESGGGWAPVQVGVHFGYNANSLGGNLIGAQAHIPVIPSGYVEILPNVDVTFLNGLRTYQYGVDAAVVSGGRRGGLYVGGGLGWRNTIFPGSDQRETRSAPSVMVGLRSGGITPVNLTVQLEARWVILANNKVDPRVLTFGVNLPLWGWDL